MIRANITATTLPEYYEKLVAAQEAAHGAHYCSHHAVIRQAASDGCSSYCECGVNQGATLACALLAGFTFVAGVDASLAPLKPWWSLFEAYAAPRMLTTCTVAECDSREPFSRPFDFLLCDALHTATGVREELLAHAQHVRRYILVHDTAANPEMGKMVELFAYVHPGPWTVQQRDTRNVGWTLLARTP